MEQTYSVSDRILLSKHTNSLLSQLQYQHTAELPNSFGNAVNSIFLSFLYDICLIA